MAHLDPIGLPIVGIIVLGFHYYLKLNMKYFNSLEGTKIHNEKIERENTRILTKKNKNEKLTFRERMHIVNLNIIDKLITTTWIVGLILITVGIVLVLLTQLTNYN